MGAVGSFAKAYGKKLGLGAAGAAGAGAVGYGAVKGNELYNRANTSLDLVDENQRKIQDMVKGLDVGSINTSAKHINDLSGKFNKTMGPDGAVGGFNMASVMPYLLSMGGAAAVGAVAGGKDNRITGGILGAILGGTGKYLYNNPTILNNAAARTKSTFNNLFG